MVCPVDCFYARPDMLVIDPKECIDCAACVSECPVEAIYGDDEVPDDQQDMIDYNAKQAQLLKDMGNQPITDTLDPLPTAEQRKAELGF